MPLKLNLIIASIILLVSCKEKKETTKLKEEITPPNIIYILADDLGYGDLSITGQTKFSTPNIDRLAKEGMFFTQHYSGATVCAPSRSALLTGLHTGHTPIRGNKEIKPEGQWPLPKGTKTLPSVLKQKGYTTGAFGKWGLGYPGSEGEPNNQGFDTFFGYNCQRLGHHYYPYHLWDNRKKFVLQGNEGYKKEQYAPVLIHNEAIKFIKRNKNTPFFLYYPSIIPHAELIAPKIYMNKYLNKFKPETPFKTKAPSDDYRNGFYESQEYPHAAFAAMVNLLDDQVGDIMNTIEDLGIAENTIIIFSSDNGPHKEGGADPDFFNSNGIYRGYKRDLYEGGIHVPMIVKWKNKITPNTQSDHISAFWDILPTLTEVANIPNNENIDGISFLPTLLRKTNQKKHSHLYWEFHEKGGRQAIRKDNWKLVKYNVLKNGEYELYNLKLDPSETNDLAKNKPDLVNELAKLLESSRTDSEVFTFKQKTYNAGD